MIRVIEAGPRDGLQNQSEQIPTAKKLQFIHTLADAGYQEIEATSFVHPKWIPQLGDCEEVCRNLPCREGLTYTVLVPNMKGLERALACDVQRVAIFTAASESFSQKNTNRSIEDALVDFASLIPRATGSGVSVRGYISTCFVCPFEGEIQPEAVLRVCDRLFELGVDEVSLGDTVGHATPNDIEKLLSLLLPRFPAERLALHLHDTCGTALANVLRGLQMGIRTFDASAGGLGGCPYAPGASGNVSSEDLLYMLHRMGYETGVDAQIVARAARELGLPLSSHQQQLPQLPAPKRKNRPLKDGSH